MTNAEKYNFADFTRCNYRNLIRLAKNHWEFRDYSQFDNTSRQVIWRHDVDYSPHCALKLAEIEAQEAGRVNHILASLSLGLTKYTVVLNSN